MNAAHRPSVETGTERIETGLNLIEVQAVTRSFPGVLALDEVDFGLEAGHVHALLGENGAGKSTLIKVLSGLYPPDSGEVYVSGEQLELGSPKASNAAGIRVVYQELNLVGPLSVRENICLGEFPRTRLGGIDWAATDERSRKALDRVGLDVDLEAPVEGMSIAEQQLIEISRALSREARILILDEPTSSLSRTEIERLFAVIRQLTARRTGVIYVTHRLEEVEELADEVTVLRDGRRVMKAARGDWTRMDIVRAMVGEELAELETDVQADYEREVLRVEGLRTESGLRDVDLTLYAGEVLGVFGLVGAGLEPLGRAIFGADPIEEGQITIASFEPTAQLTPRSARKRGLGFVTADRKHDGLIGELSVRKNITIAALDAYARVGWLNRRAEGRGARSMVDRLRIRTPSLAQTVSLLSGGNQQKALLARWLMTNPRVLILAEPTRGVDVGAKAEIYKLIDEVTVEGVGVLVLSTDAEEITKICDRALVLRHGQVVEDLKRSAITQEALVGAATGAMERGAESP
jgi:ribose transport system ATP-binding protein